MELPQFKRVQQSPAKALHREGLPVSKGPSLTLLDSIGNLET